MSSSTNDSHFDSTVALTNSDKSLKGKSFSNAKFLSVISICCVVFLLAVFAFDYSLSKSSQQQSPTPINSASVIHHSSSSANQNYATVAANLEPIKIIETQNGFGEVNAITITTALSENDFRQEAQNIVFRDEESQRTNLQAHATRMDTALSNENFRVEAEHVLYRDENK